MSLVFAGPELADPAVVGHKFARQATLLARGFPVPEFFCVPAGEFDRVARPELADPAERRAAVLAAGVPEPLAAEVLRAFDDLVGPDGMVAVRACVVSGDGGAAEDGADDPFAGLSDSFLYVRRADVPRRVAECWASAFNPHAVRYRERRGVDPGSARVAVGVQRMVHGRRSFVAFTRDPRDGDDRRVVASAYGIGEGVVQERADVDHFFLDPRTGSVRAAVVTKSTMVGPDPDRPDAGPCQAPVPADLADVPVLTDAEVRAVCALADRTERLFGVPQDIEGTLTEDGAIHLVQARPMVLPEPAGAIWTNHNLTESFPGVTCALTYSQATDFYRLSFGDFYRRMGVPPDDAAAADLRRMIDRVDGRVYYRLDAWYRLHGRLPGFGLLRPHWQRALGLSADELADAPPVPRVGRVRTAVRLAGPLLRLPGSARRFLRWWDGFVAEIGALDGCDAGELVDRHGRLWAAFADRWAVTLVNSYYLLANLALANRLLDRWVADRDPALLPALLAGGRESRSLAALRSALAIAERMRADPALRAELGSGDDRACYSGIMAGRFGQDLAGALAEHLRRYGDRTVHDLKLEVRTPRQEPWTVLALLRPLVEQDLTVAGSRDDERRGHADGLAMLRAACRNPLRRFVLRAVLAGLRWFVRVREDTRFCRSQLYGVTRDVLWRLGAALVDADRLDAAEDVTHLTVTEVVAAVRGELDGDDLREVVAHRRAELAAAQARPLPPAYFRHGNREPVPTPAAGSATVLRGLASSSGVVRARAKVVLTPTVAADDCRDHILIARETDPGWLYLMLAAKGIVVERGSLLSHTAITGRLLGIPTVVAVRDATTGIADGRWIELDGSAGTVRLLSDEEVAA